MKKEEFLDLINDIDDKFLNELAESEPGGKRVKFLPEDYGAPQKPQVIRLERPPKRHAPFIAAFTAAAVLVCIITAGVFVKLNKPQTVSPGSGVTLSETSGISEPVISEAKIDRVNRDGYDFSLEIIDGEKSLRSCQIPKTDSENEIAIAVDNDPESVGRSFSIVFFSYHDGKEVDRIAKLDFTAKSDIQCFSVPYEWNELEKGDECIMLLIAADGDYTKYAVVKGKILP